MGRWDQDKRPDVELLADFEIYSCVYFTTKTEEKIHWENMKLKRWIQR